MEKINMDYKRRTWKIEANGDQDLLSVKYSPVIRNQVPLS